MGEHPIEGLMRTAMDSIQDMVDVNTIIGDPIQTQNNKVIIPISKVSFGFAAGGSEFKGETLNEYKKVDKDEQIQYTLPFGGGAGAGVNINPIAFLIVEENGVKLMPINHSGAMDKLVDFIPDFLEKANCSIEKLVNKKEEKKAKNDIKNKEEKKNIKSKINKIPKKMKDIEIEYDETDNESEEYLEDE
ncbi:MAG: GerW family sporulation protein [Candidatus Scatovivens sp.]